MNTMKQVLGYLTLVAACVGASYAVMRFVQLTDAKVEEKRKAFAEECAKRGDKVTIEFGGKVSCTMEMKAQ